MQSLQHLILICCLVALYPTSARRANQQIIEVRSILPWYLEFQFDLRHNKNFQPESLCIWRNRNRVNTEESRIYFTPISSAHFKVFKNAKPLNFFVGEIINIELQYTPPKSDIEEEGEFHSFLNFTYKIRGTDRDTFTIDFGQKDVERTTSTTTTAKSIITLTESVAKNGKLMSMWNSFRSWCSATIPATITSTTPSTTKTTKPTTKPSTSASHSDSIYFREASKPHVTAAMDKDRVPLHRELPTEVIWGRHTRGVTTITPSTAAPSTTTTTPSTTTRILPSCSDKLFSSKIPNDSPTKSALQNEGNSRSHRLLLKASTWSHPTNAVDTVREFIFYTLELPHLAYDILQAKFVDDGLLFEMTQPACAAEVLTQACLFLEQRRTLKSNEVSISTTELDFFDFSLLQRSLVD